MDELAKIRRVLGKLDARRAARSAAGDRRHHRPERDQSGAPVPHGDRRDRPGRDQARRHRQRRRGVRAGARSSACRSASSASAKPPTTCASSMPAAFVDALLPASLGEAECLKHDGRFRRPPAALVRRHGRKTCPGSIRARRIACGCRKSCCSRRRSRRSCRTFCALWKSCTIYANSPQHRSTTCSPRGRASAITAARATCIVRRRFASSATAASCRSDFDALLALPGIGRSTAGAILAQAHGICAFRFSTATSSACWRACTVSRLARTTANTQNELWTIRRIAHAASHASPTTRRRSWISARRVCTRIKPTLRANVRWRRIASRIATDLTVALPDAQTARALCRRARR